MISGTVSWMLRHRNDGQTNTARPWSCIRHHPKHTACLWHYRTSPFEFLTIMPFDDESNGHKEVKNHAQELTCAFKHLFPPPPPAHKATGITKAQAHSTAQC